MRTRLLISAVALLLLAFAGHADSLRQATTTDFFSPDGAYRLRVDPTPGDLRVTLARKTLGIYLRSWSTSVHMAMFPSNAVIAPDGTFAALLTGYVQRTRTENAILVFNQNGVVVRAIPLTQVFTPVELRSLSTVSGYAWLLSVSLTVQPAPVLRFSGGSRLIPPPTPGVIYDPPYLPEVRFRIPLPSGPVTRE